MGNILEALTTKAVDRKWDTTAKEVWKQKMANNFTNRKLLGPKDVHLRYAGTVQPTESLRLCLLDYAKACRGRGGRTYIVYGCNGSGKSQTLLAIARGTSMWHPSRGIFVNVWGNCNNGNEYMKQLCKVLSFNGDSCSDLASDLVEIAVNPSRSRQLDCFVGSETVDQGKLIKIFPAFEAPARQFDKMPVIILDNVEFTCKEEDDLSDANTHADFQNFIGTLYDAAHASGVVVFLGVSNQYIAAKLAIFNGGTKIRPATVSILGLTFAGVNILALGDPHSDSNNEDNCWEHKCKCDGGNEMKTVWRHNLGWTKDNMKIFLTREFKTAPPQLIERAAKVFGEAGILRAALDDLMADGEFPATSTLADNATADASQGDH